jgi:hypothetical protein
MSFRKQRRNDLVSAWADWRKEYAPLIEQTGLPEYCFTPENWDELLEYGSLFHNPGSIDELSIRQKAALLRLIMTRPKDLESYAAQVLTRALLDAVENGW